MLKGTCNSFGLNDLPILINQLNELQKENHELKQLILCNAVLERALKQACRHLNMLHKICFRREGVQYYPSVYIVEAEAELAQERTDAK